MEAALPILRPTRSRALALMIAKLDFKARPQDILRHSAASMLMATQEAPGRTLDSPPVPGFSGGR